MTIKEVNISLWGAWGGKIYGF